MPIALTDEHEALRQTVRRWVENRCPPAVPRAMLDAEVETLPPFWDDLVAQGWLGLHLPEAHGGQGFGYVELAVVLEELGRASAPGPFLASVWAAAAVDATGDDALRAALLPGLADGTAIGAVALAGDIAAEATDGGAVRLTGTARPVLSGHLASLLVVPARLSEQEEEVWCMVDASAPGVEVTVLPSLDPTRRMAAVELHRVSVAADRRLKNVDRARIGDLGATLAAAELAGVAGWCLDTAASYAKVREQFGRPIGQFQAVKHKCSDMLIAVEQATGVAWDAARAAADPEQAPVTAAVAATIAPDAAFHCAKECVQLLGGIGFTWEHDAHVYLRRAASLRQLLDGPAPWRRRTADLARAGARRYLDLDLPPEAERHRAEVRAFLDAITGASPEEQRVRMADEGWLVPHWPKPWGRDAGALEQLVIDEEFKRAEVVRPSLSVGAWAAPTIVAAGTPEQQERWVGPTLRGEIQWCQLFSEPGAGSDLASLATKAVRTDGGWLLSGQKVWTTLAREADWGICLARTDPNVPKHEGITYFVVDMRSEGLDIRPLRELTGHAMFNEVFLSDVFVADDSVVGTVNGGWALARTTLANERVSMGSGASFGGGVGNLLKLLQRRPDLVDDVVLDEVGALLAEAQSLSLLGYRTTLRALSGAEPGPESSVRKLLGVEHDQRVQEVGMTLLGTEATTTEGLAGRWTFGFLANRCLTIAGGTSEVQRNVIAERLLGLPRDPEPTPARARG